MTKRLTIALVAVALFVLLAVMPVSAVTTSNSNGTQIDMGATIFIGEEGLNLTHALNQVDKGTKGTGAYDNTPLNLSVGWWASAADIGKSSPTKSVQLDTIYKNFQVAPATFVGYTGNWYVLGTDGKYAMPNALFNVQDPTLSVAVWDFQQSKDVTGMSVPQGEHLSVQVNTNMYPATYSTRNNTVWNVSIGAVVAPASGYLPDGSSSPWNWNSTGASNNSWVETTYTGQVASNVYRVTNGSTVYKMTYGTYASANGLSVMYWNNSAIQDDSYTAKNYTTDNKGLAGGSAVVWNAAAVVAPSFGPVAEKDGYITIKVKDEAGATFDKLIIGNDVKSNSTSITKQFVNKQPWTLGDASNYWVTDARDSSNQYAYPVGTYSVWAESLLNNMKDNYRNAGADYTGKTVSATGTVTLVSDTVKIEANKDSVVRSKAFSVTVTGKPSTPYYIWVKGTSSLTSLYDSQPPMIAENQEKVYFDDYKLAGAGTHLIGNYLFENGGGSSTDNIYNDVAASTDATFNRTRYYAMINTSSSGTRTVEWITNNMTKAQKYTIRVEQNMPYTTSGFGAPYGMGTVKSDEVDINVEKGAVTIVAAGDQSYYLGEEIKFSGTNTETYTTYLFIIGPNLESVGSKIQEQDPRDKKVVDGDASSFKAIAVNGDNTWSWKWGTSNYALDAGTYTIYAVSQPRDKDHLQNTAYGTVSIIIKKPFVSATASQSTVAKGDRVYISGTAEGDPSNVKIWIMGKNKVILDTASVNSDASFKYEIKQEVTKVLASGQYFVVVQHPMQNNKFDVDKDGDYVINRMLQTQGTTNYTKIFKITGSGSLQGSDAAEALAQGINDANVDDTYTKLQFLVEEPTIRIDPIGDKHVGDKFTITAQTNLAVDDEVLVQVYSSSFKPTQKSQSGEFSGATGTVKVTKGDAGYNKISFDVDSSTFKPDEYIVTADAVLQEATGTALFNVLETSAATVAPTSVVTAAPTAAQTAAPTQAPTAAPTATATKSPGFGALIALIGLGAVAFVVVRRH